MRRSPNPLSRLPTALLLSGLACGTATAADLAFEALPPPAFRAAPTGGGYRVAPWPVRPRPRRFDAYGYPILSPLVAGGPDPLAVPGGCPPALEPTYDAVGNLAGDAVFPNCR